MPRSGLFRFDMPPAWEDGKSEDIIEGIYCCAEPGTFALYALPMRIGTLAAPVNNDGTGDFFFVGPGVYGYGLWGEYA